MLDTVSDEAFARYVKQTGMATPEQIDSARKQAPLPLGEALVKLGVITPLQRETVEKKLEGQREGVGELAGCKLLKKIGEGGMGAVYLAEDGARKRKVAIKILPKKHASNPEFLKRFRREVEAATKLDHPNIVQAYSAGEDHGYHFYIMEYCEGESLRKRIERLKYLPHPDACGLVTQIAQGLKHAHDQGFIHRDVKPENLIVTPANVVKILDLGLAKNLEDADASFRTATGAALGTPHYISPEQARGDKDVDGRSDIYSLGATFYHLITGQVPFQGSSIFEIIQKHLMEQLADPRDLRPEIPETVVQVVRKMLAKSPDHRYRDCGELLSDLELVSSKKAPLTAPIDASLTSMAMPRNTVLAKPAAPAARKNGLVIGGAAAALLLVGIVAYAVWPTTPPASPSSPPKKPPPPLLAKNDPPKVEKTEPKIEEPKPGPAKPSDPSQGKPEPTRLEPEPVKPEPEPTKPEPVKPEPPTLEPAKPEPEPVKPEPAKPAKLPVPANRVAAEAAFRAEYKDDLAKPAASDMIAFAKRLLAPAPALNPAEHYQRLLGARDLAARGGDPETVINAVDRLADSFVVEPLPLKTDGIVACTTKTRDGATATANVAFQLIDEAIQMDRYDLASKLATKAKSAADSLKDDELKAAAAAREKAVTLFSKEFQSVAGYAKTLGEKPDDGASNFQMGRFYCLVKEDWDRGLRMLAKGTHKEYRAVAEKELANVKGGQVPKEICETWLSLARSEPKGLRKDNLTERARHWFTQAEGIFLPTDAEKVAKDLELLEKGAAPKTAVPKPTGPKPADPVGVDLLKKVNQAVLTRGRGTWTFSGGVLVSPSDGDNMSPALIHLPCVFGEEYDLVIEAQRTSGWEDIVFALSSGKNEFGMGLDGWQGNGAGLNGPGGGFAWQRRGPGRVFADGRPHTIRFEVRRSSATLRVEGIANPILELQDYSQSSIPRPSMTDGRAQGCLSIATVRSTFRITKVFLAPIQNRPK